MKSEKDIRDDEIRVVGGSSKPAKEKQGGRGVKIAIIVLIVIALAGCAAYYIFCDRVQGEPEEESYFEPMPNKLATSMTHFATPKTKPVQRDIFIREVADSVAGFCMIRDTTINDIPLRIHIPHNAVPELHVGAVDHNDSTIVYAAQAADIRRDNLKIVGAFVLKGEPLAWGLSKKGYCAIIDGKVTVGRADNSPLFEEATEKGGYFFRQYPLVDNGQLVDNEPKNKSIRRSLCDRNGEIMMVESTTAESFHDFAQALVDLGVDQAIYLVGSSSYGWSVAEDGTRTEFGVRNTRRLPRMTSYLIWRKR